MKKLLLSIILSISFLGLNLNNYILTTNNVSAESCVDYFMGNGYPQENAEYQCNSAPPALTGWCDGTGSNIVYNTMPWSSRWYYINSDNWISLGDVWSCFNEGGCGNNNSIDINCVQNTITDNRLKESNFITGRKCINNCSGNDILHSYTEGTPNPNQPKYNLNITNSVNIGDKIRVLVHLHNNATANQYETDDTKIVLNWNETTKIINSTILYSTDNGNSYQTKNSNNLAVNLANNTKLVPVSLSRLNASGAASTYEVSNLTPNGNDFVVDQDNKTLTYDIGSHNSCFYHRKFIYIDFDVIEVANPSFTINKDSMPAPSTDVLPGSNLEYSITVHNDGNVNISNLLVSDKLDGNLDYLSGGTYNQPEHKVSLDFGSLAINETKSKIIQVKIKDSAVGNNICNYASNVSGIGTANGEPVDSELLYNVCHNLFPPLESSFFVDKTSPTAGEEVQPSEPIQYTITVTNDGDTNINELTVTDKLDDNVQYISGGDSYNQNTHTVNLDFDVVGPGQTDSQNINVKVVQNPVGDNLCNYGYNVEATGYSPSGEELIDNPDGDICHYLQSTPLEDSFVINKSATPNINEVLEPGDNIVYTLEVYNDGETNLTNVTATDILDSNVSFVSPVNGNSGITHDGSPFGGTVSVYFDSLPVGETINKAFIVKVVDNPDDTRVCNNGFNVNASATTPNGVEITDHLDVNICHDLDLPTPHYKISKIDGFSDGEVYQIGQEFDYTINIQNISNTLIPQIIATDTLPIDIEWVDSNNDPNISYNESTRTVTITFLNIEQQHTSKSFKVRVSDTATPCAEICNTVTSSFDGSGNGIGINPIGDEPSPILNHVSGGGGFLDQISDFGANLWNSITNFTSNLFSSIIEITTAAEQPDDPIANDPTTDEFCRPVFCNGSELNLTKSSDPVNGAHVLNGNEITYFIKVSNPLTEALNNIIIQDQLEENLIYSGSDFEEVTNQGNSVSLNFGNIAPLSDKELSFRATVVTSGEEPVEICNFATYDTGNSMMPSNEVCHPYGEPVCGNGIVEPPEQCDPPQEGVCNADCTTPGGGGGGETSPTIDVCTERNNGSLSCMGKTPDRSNPYLWQFWKDCLDEKEGIPNYENICLHEWADEAGFTAMGFCAIDSDCEKITPPGDGCIVGGCSILEGRIEKKLVKPHVAANKNAEYNVIVWLKNTTTQPVTIQLTDLKVYDLSVPTESGWIWKRDLGQALENWSLVSDDNGINYFHFNNSESILLQPGVETEISRNLSYSMNTALTINSDTAQVKNVVFAAMKFRAPYYSLSNGFIKGQTQSWNLRLNEISGMNQSQELCDENGVPLPNFFYGATSTYGDTAIVEIDRPYIEVRKGADLGISKYNELVNPFGGYLNKSDLTGDSLNIKSSGEKIDNFDESSDYLFDTFRDNLINKTTTLGGKTFTTTDDNSNVWFYDGGNGPVVINNSSLDLSTPMTFVISNTNLIIENNFVLNNSFASFIVENGNIIIDKDVSNIEGIFIAKDDNSKIISRNNEESSVQLEISGAIMGDALNLLQNRTYIGNLNNTPFILEPSIKINYDVRLLNGTPPALEEFLGEGSVWGQEY